MVNKEGLYSQIVSNFYPETPVLDIDGSLTQPEKDLHFAMRCNGYFMLENGQWVFNSVATPFDKQFAGTKVSFFGPNGYDDFFNSGKYLGYERFLPAFEQPGVTDVIRKYRQVDEDLAAIIAYFLGGIVRHRISKTPAGKVNAEEIANSVRFVSRRTLLGEERSAEAITAAMSMYVISGGPIEEDKEFVGGIYHMAEAIREDPVIPFDTLDLGLSQVLRLHSFLDKTQGRGYQDLQDLAVIAPQLEVFDGFPTVGAEFHFSPDAPKQHPYFWQRLALLNMSQYQTGSYVQLSRNDREVVEVRMNPSIYPVTIANWNHMRQLLPELNQTFFTITINRRGVTKDFHWNNNDNNLLNQLRALGLISYAGIFENIPHTKKPAEIGFGKVYLGQTVRLGEGGYKFSGGWYGGEGTEGQMGIYAGFGDNLPYLAYYLSMALAKPDILKSVHHQLSKVTTLEDAFNHLNADSRGYVSREIQRRVESDERLNRAFEAGQEIVELLNP